MANESSADPTAAVSRVAIIGGGCAALTAAWELSRSEHQGRYQITVYQMGHRLGGKGASGRGPHARIEEHGLHLWLGFYENAFKLMRECYAELARDRFSCPIATWEDAFEPAPFVGVTDRLQSGEWDCWLAHFPPGKGLPGDPMEDGALNLSTHLSKAAALAAELLRSAAMQNEGDPESPRGPSPGLPESIVDAVDWALRHGQLATAAALVEAMELLRRALHGILPGSLGADRGVLLRLTDAIALAARRQLGMVVGGDTALRRTWVVVDLLLAIIRGSISFGLGVDPRGFDAIDDYDWREWLELNGASPASLDSGFVRGIYDLTFAYEDGDVERPRLSAAAALRGALRMFFTYRGAFFWRMGAGMGDIVFAPLYEVLKRRGVRFEFFHRVTALEPGGGDGKDTLHVARLHFDVQARVKGGGEYEPLVRVKGVPSWPAEPNTDQLTGGARIQREGRDFEAPWEDRGVEKLTLEVGRDFDFVVLGVGGGAVRQVCSELVAISPTWRKMVDNLHSVATQALQLWMSEDMEQLGWPHPPVTLSGWVEPFDTWADMRHLIPAEDFRGRVKSIAYFCSPLRTPPVEIADQDARAYLAGKQDVRNAAVRFLERDIGKIWPNALDSRGEFRWELLVGSEEQRTLEGPNRIDTQFWIANLRPSDRYVLSLPGTQRYRLSPLDMTFDNLTVCGDWTRSGLNTGCVESAVMSGLLAAHALAKRPALEDIVGYDHP